MLDSWIEENYSELEKISNRVSKSTNKDLLQICIEQFLNNPRVLELDHKEKLYFFTKIVRNNYYSDTSPYYYTYHKFQFQEYNEDVNSIINEEYHESEINLEWVYKQLKNFEWYYRKLFELYIEEGCSITKLSKRTTIPLNSVSRDINKVRRQLKKLRKKYV